MALRAASTTLITAMIGSRASARPCNPYAEAHPLERGARGRMALQSRLMTTLLDQSTGAAARRFSAVAAQNTREDALLFDDGFTFRNFVADAFAVFMFVLWFWLFVSVASDLFRRNDISGWGKVLW